MPSDETIRADAVVIGAGLGGLGAAGYLARAGHNVVVLEHHAVPGGYAHEFKRRGFRFEVALHALDGVGRGGWRRSRPSRWGSTACSQRSDVSRPTNDYSENPAYVQIKNEAADRLIDRAGHLIPGLRESIVVKEVATPLTNVRYGLSPEGSIYGRQQTVENLLNRRSPKTPIPNLLLAGAWVGGGGMSTALGSGRTAASIAGRLLTPG